MATVEAFVGRVLQGDLGYTFVVLQQSISNELNLRELGKPSDQRVQERTSSFFNFLIAMPIVVR